MDFTDLDANAREQLGRRIDHARKNLGLSLDQLAHRAGYDERTIRNVIAGRTTRIKTVREICEVVDIAPHGEQAEVDVSADDYGAYTAHQFQEYIGYYYAYRRSFSFPRNLLRTIYEFEWSREKHCLLFNDNHRYHSDILRRPVDFTQKGEVYISNTVGLIHLLTRVRGAVRLITLTKLRLDDLTMQGIILTQAQRTFYFQPSVSPIFLQQTDKSYTLEELTKQVGPIRPGDPDYETVADFLAEVERNIGIFAWGANADHPRLTITSAQTVAS